MLATFAMIVLSFHMFPGKQRKGGSGEERKDSKLTWMCACVFTYILQTVLQRTSIEIQCICALYFQSPTAFSHFSLSSVTFTKRLINVLEKWFWPVKS